MNMVLALEFVGGDDIPKILWDDVGSNEIDLVGPIGSASGEHAAGVGTATQELSRFDLYAQKPPAVLDGEVVMGHFAPRISDT